MKRAGLFTKALLGVVAFGLSGTGGPCRADAQSPTGDVGQATSTPAQAPDSKATLHPTVDVDSLDTTAPALRARRKTVREAIRGQKTEREMLSPWSKTIPGWDEAWAICLTPAARVTAVLYNGERVHLDEEAIRAEIDSALRDAKDVLRFQIGLSSKGRGSWLLPYKAGAGNKQVLADVRFVLGVDDSVNVQANDARIIESHDHTSRFWAGMIAGGTRTKVDYYATYSVGFPLRGRAGEAVVRPESRMLLLRVVGPRKEFVVPFDLGKLPRQLRDLRGSRSAGS